MFDLRWGEITALQPLIYRAGTLHHAACVTPEAAGAFQNSLYWVLQHSLRPSWSLNFISFMQAVMNETEVYCISGWFSILRQSIHLSITFKLFTSDEQLRCKLHLTRYAKPFFPLHENNCELIWIFFLLLFRSGITDTKVIRSWAVKAWFMQLGPVYCVVILLTYSSLHPAILHF